MSKYTYTANEYIGKKINKLTILKIVKSPNTRRDSGRNVLCRCDCGREVILSISDVVEGRKKSCGSKECWAQRNVKTHHMSNSRIYKIYYGMLERCYNPKHVKFKYYGGKNPPIKVYKPWRDSFMEFYNWAINNGWHDQPKDTPFNEILSIERENPNGNYEPDNCKWITMKEQKSNTSATSYIWDGEEWLTYRHFNEKYNLSNSFVSNRLKSGWDFSAIVYSAKNPELGLKKATFKKSKEYEYRDKDEFIRLVPILIPPNDGIHYQINKIEPDVITKSKRSEETKRKYKENYEARRSIYNENRRKRYHELRALGNNPNSPKHN